MAFGRETPTQQQRIDRIGHWLRQRSRISLAAVMFGLLAVVDAWTMVIGVLAGVVAIGLGAYGLNDLARRPEVAGRRLCTVAIMLGMLGIALSILVYVWIYRRL